MLTVSVTAFGYIAICLLALLRCLGRPWCTLYISRSIGLPCARAAPTAAMHML